MFNRVNKSTKMENTLPEVRYIPIKKLVKAHVFQDSIILAIISVQWVVMVGK